MLSWFLPKPLFLLVKKGILSRREIRLSCQVRFIARAQNEHGLWYIVEITGDPDNPKRSSRISVQWAREPSRNGARINPWVWVNVFGKFPPSSFNALIGPEEVEPR